MSSTLDTLPDSPMPYEPAKSSDAPPWPYASLLILGIFGASDPAGKRVSFRGRIAAVVFLVGVFMLQLETALIITTLGRVAMVGAALLLGWAWAQYLGSLDELSRLIQLEAFAWSYGGLFVVGFLASALGGGPMVASVDPIWIVFGELIRGPALVMVARRYR
jgi:hypothetical protein